MSKAPSSFSSQLAPDLIAKVHLSLLAWYEAEQRDLPWRTTSDPYAILVSEIMLQQTQVDRVLPKYRQFLTTFPTLADLAAAPTADVISAWVPLGYNMRAVRLQSIARQVIADYNGRIPNTIDELLKLKGIGRYTAGAIACLRTVSRWLRSIPISAACCTASSWAWSIPKPERMMPRCLNWQSRSSRKVMPIAGIRRLWIWVRRSAPAIIHNAHAVLYRKPARHTQTCASIASSHREQFCVNCAKLLRRKQPTRHNLSPVAIATSVGASLMCSAHYPSMSACHSPC